MYIGVHYPEATGICRPAHVPGTGEQEETGFFPVFRTADERTECFLWFLPRLISLTVMAEENPQPQNTGEPSQAPQQQTGQQPRTPQGQGSGQRRNDRRDHSRHHGGQAGPSPARPATVPSGRQHAGKNRSETAPGKDHRQKTRTMTMRKRPSTTAPPRRAGTTAAAGPQKGYRGMGKRPVLRIRIRKSGSLPAPGRNPPEHSFFSDYSFRHNHLHRSFPGGEHLTANSRAGMPAGCDIK